MEGEGVKSKNARENKTHVKLLNCIIISYKVYQVGFQKPSPCIWGISNDEDLIMNSCSSFRHQKVVVELMMIEGASVMMIGKYLMAVLLFRYPLE